jgi:hypothetical protein
VWGGDALRMLQVPITSVGPVHNAQVCYIPRRAPRQSFPFCTSVLYPVDPPPGPSNPPPVLPISHSGSLTRQAPGPVLHIFPAGCKRERRRRSSRSHFWWQHMEGHPRLFRSHCPSGLKTQNQ